LIYLDEAAGCVVAGVVVAAAGAASGGCVGTEGFGVSAVGRAEATEPAGRKSPTGMTPWYEFTE
jgi:hypothetical protein